MPGFGRADVRPEDGRGVAAPCPIVGPQRAVGDFQVDFRGLIVVGVGALGHLPGARTARGGEGGSLVTRRGGAVVEVPACVGDAEHAVRGEHQQTALVVLPRAHQLALHQYEGVAFRFGRREQVPQREQHRQPQDGDEGHRRHDPDADQDAADEGERPFSPPGSRIVVAPVRIAHRPVGLRHAPPPQSSHRPMNIFHPRVSAACGGWRYPGWGCSMRIGQDRRGCSQPPPPWPPAGTADCQRSRLLSVQESGNTPVRQGVGAS